MHYVCLDTTKYCNSSCHLRQWFRRNFTQANAKILLLVVPLAVGVESASPWLVCIGPEDISLRRRFIPKIFHSEDISFRRLFVLKTFHSEDGRHFIPKTFQFRRHFVLKAFRSENLSSSRHFIPKTFHCEDYFTQFARKLAQNPK